MNISELSKTPREVTLGNITLKVRRLTLEELFCFFEEKIRNKKRKEAEKMSAILSAEERMKFLQSAWEKLSSEEISFDQIAENMMGSVDGLYDILYLASKDFGGKREDIKDAISLTDLPNITPVVNFITGVEKKQVLEGKEGKEGKEEIGGAEKKTEEK